MAVQIGSISPDFSDPLRLLSDCHRRVEMFLNTLRAIGNTYNLLDEEDARALENSLRYFRQAAPKHTADEEESLFPRLRQQLGSEDHPALVQLDRLEQDHRWAGPLHDEIEEIGALWIADRKISTHQHERFRSAVERLQKMYSDHIELEDAVLFPFSAQVLRVDEKQQIGLEMAARRQVIVHAGPQLTIGDEPKKA
jgi:hemerythrin-like domain-containing protein